jgi:hypothetical protein
VSARSKKRRRLRRRRAWRNLLATVARTGKLYVAPDVWARWRSSSKVAQIVAHVAHLGARIEVREVSMLPRGTIMAIAEPRRSPFESLLDRFNRSSSSQQIFSRPSNGDVW